MPVSPAHLNAQWTRPLSAFCTPKLAGRHSPCLKVQLCNHERCHFLHAVVKKHCSLCGRPIGWGRNLKPDPQCQLFGPSWVHVECAAEGEGFSLLRRAREYVRAAASSRRRR
jgi:hypothetical protein